MARRPSMMQAGGNLAQRIGGTSGFNPGASQTFSLAGYAAGNFALISNYCPASNSATAAGWTRATYTWPTSGYVSVFLWKVLDAADIAAGVTITGMLATANRHATTLDVYDGPGAAAVVGSARSDVSSSVSVGVVTPDAKSIGFVSFLHKRADETNPTPPAQSTRRTVATIPGSFGTAAVADIVDPVDYAGAAFAWTGLNTSNDQASVVIELREA